MTSPRHGFGAHDCDLLSFCGLNERLDARMEFLRLHIIGEAAERSVVPSRVEGVCPCVAQSAQFLHVRVPNAGLKQRPWQYVSIELWIVPGTWDCPKIGRAHV